jgi:predicted dehydrogenase
MSKFKVAIAGCGGMAKVWAEYAIKRQDAEIVALVDIYPDNARKFAERFGLRCGIFADLKEAIAASGANLVFDVTIPESHFNVMTTAVASGCHVFGEKPMAATMEEAKRMIEEAEKHGKQYAVMQNRRYNRNIRALREIAASEALGPIGFACADFFLGPHFGGFRDAMESPLLLDMAIHTFDQVRFILGKDPISVYCHEFNPAGSWYQGNAAAVCIFEYADGSVFCYRGSWCAEGAPTSWEASWRLMGSKGTALWDGTNAPYYETVIPSTESKFMNDYNHIVSEPAWEGQDGHFGCLDEMFAALLEGRPAETDCRDNIKSLAMVHGALQSAKEGRKVLL